VTTDRGRPTYKLEELWEALDGGAVRFSRAAREGFTALGWNESDAVDCLRSLCSGDFRKSMIGREISGWHDVYRTRWKDERIYIHFCFREYDGSFLIASFKRDMDFD
jgi:Motility quorum-sensing regulator, toxin of MqsA